MQPAARAVALRRQAQCLSRRAKEENMSVLAIVLIVVAVLLLAAAAVAVRQRRRVAGRSEARELRRNAEHKTVTAESLRATAEERAARADRAEAEAREKAAQAQRERASATQSGELADQTATAVRDIHDRARDVDPDAPGAEQEARELDRSGRADARDPAGSRNSN
jgi:FtsZ-interacting cell division protein ZipA